MFTPCATSGFLDDRENNMTAPHNPLVTESLAVPLSVEDRGPFIILAVISRSTSTKRRTSAKTHFSVQETVPVMVGTTFIVPALRGWGIGYGETDPWDLSKKEDPIGAPGWKKTDHHLGYAFVNVWVDHINPPDHSTEISTQTAVINIAANLGDHNLDDKWWAWVTYSLTCLARHP
jgi:hypothetical protein